MDLRKFLLVVFCIYSLFFVIGSTLAPITAHFGLYDLSGKLTATYMYSCHQQPTKSFWLMGYPIALCARCYGFYIGVVISTILALFNKFRINLKTFFIILLLVIIDLFINYILKHTTGIYLRFTTGLFMGAIFTITISYISNIKNKGEKNV